MTIENTEAGPLGPYLRLFDPGQRVGWVYRDPESLRQPFVEAEPQRQALDGSYENRVQAARLDRKDRISSALRIGIPVAVVSYLLSLLFTVMLTLGGVVIGIQVARALYASLRFSFATRARTAQEKALEERFQHDWQSWHQRWTLHEGQQTQWVAGLDAWGALPFGADTRRLDVFGGSQRGREGFLTVFGASTLRDRPLIVLDLTQALVCRELSVLAEAGGVPVDVQLLPSRMTESGIVGGLAPHELVQALVEAMHGDSPESGRAERAVYTRILTQLCGALGEDVSLARIGAGLRVLVGETDDAKALSREERNRIADDLFTDKNKDQMRDSLIRLASFVHPLEQLGTAREGRGPGYLTCVALDFSAGSASTELLADLAMQSVMRRLSSFQEEAPGVVVVLGEQGLQRRHLESLAQLCERRGAQLTFVHSHLREAGEELIGGGTVAFMRLGNHQEATVAADFLGRHHSFVLHSLTDTEGRTVNTSVAKTLGSSLSRSTTTSHSVTEGRNWGSSRSSTYQGWFNPLSTSDSANSGGSYSETTGTSTSTTHTTNESTTHTTGDSDSTSLATGRQRVYEYALEPTQLQSLAEFNLLVVERQPGGAVQVHAADCNPNVVLLDRVSTQPLPRFDALPHHSPAPAIAAEQAHPEPQHHYPPVQPGTAQQPYAAALQQPYAAAPQAMPPHQPYVPAAPQAPGTPWSPSPGQPADPRAWGVPQQPPPPQQPPGGWTQGPPPNWPGQQ
ncbi:hypothetical protein [Streptomyces scabiei]|uniref:hypothetical protein n=1 Tax=Streptomyces scabiei TaxID=1930 RepID=UPI000773C5CA|nr:hypothetical protein [Streptomyces scabiei]MBP5929826.1 hypothetical protein [Streptomyces sp. LBUM 1479]MDX2535696.1 hypothetical protein [Streptomyces scabiei]MDX2796955.1 hypothetical protein [Streptomyces scabiei]MDX2859799.1 hypothetical protein [Streptomyces scabiei]MDX3825709.1 hypothetical protein [Streptomyces scabiei]